MHHHHEHARSHSNVEQDERAVTRWLNRMEASLANPGTPFSMACFSRAEIRAINNYIDTHEQYLGRYERFLPPIEITPMS